MLEAQATRYLHKTGWLKLYRSEESFAGTTRERDYARELGLELKALSPEETRGLEPSLAPVFRHAVIAPDAASVTNPGAVAKAYAELFTRLGGVILKGDALTLHRSGRGLAGRHRRGPGRWQAGRDRARALGARCAGSARHPPAAEVQARLSPAFQVPRQCRPDAAGGRRRLRLLPCADGAGHPPHHRRGIRRARRGPDAGSVRPAVAGRARRFIRWATPSRRSPGWARGRALPIHAR